MKTYGIICEYNPFHNGHIKQIEETRKQGATHIVAIMSGNYVQRGDVAIVDKFARAEAAVKNGVDLVIEMPVSYSLASAEMFARAGMLLLGSLGCVEGISFGSENGDVDILKNAAAAALSVSTAENLKPLLEKGMSYPEAVQDLVGQKHGPILADVFDHPNNVLAVEYLKAMKMLNLDMEVFTLKRDVNHDDEAVSENIASGMKIREMIEDGEDYAKFMPKEMAETIAKLDEEDRLAYFDNLEREILYMLRTLTPEQISQLPDVGQGLENRIAQVGRSTTSLDEYLETVDTKRYTQAKMRRILLNMLIGINKLDLQTPPTYGRVLALNERGAEIIKAANLQVKDKKPEEIVNKLIRPISPSLKDIIDLKVPQMNRNVEITCRSSDIYMLASKEIGECGSDFTHKIELIK